MKAQILSLALLAATRAVASNEYWTDDEELFHLVNVPSLFANFTEETRHLTSDGQGLTLDGVLFHSNVSYEQTDLDDNVDVVRASSLLPRGSGVHCSAPICSFSGPQYLNSIQEGEVAHKLCPLLSKYAPNNKQGGVSIYATGAMCRDGVKCSLSAAASFLFMDHDSKGGLINHCNAQVNSLVGQCSGASGTQNCKNGPSKKKSNLVSMTLGAQTIHGICGSSKPDDEHCKKIKCDSANNNCQSF